MQRRIIDAFSYAGVVQAICFRGSGPSFLQRRGGNILAQHQHSWWWLRGTLATHDASLYSLGGFFWHVSDKAFDLCVCAQPQFFRGVAGKADEAGLVGICAMLISISNTRNFFGISMTEHLARVSR